MSQKELADWYLRKGYKWKPVITGEMEKTLKQIPAIQWGESLSEGMAMKTRMEEELSCKD